MLTISLLLLNFKSSFPSMLYDAELDPVHHSSCQLPSDGKGAGGTPPQLPGESHYYPSDSLLASLTGTRVHSFPVRSLPSRQAASWQLSWPFCKMNS